MKETVFVGVHREAFFFLFSHAIVLLLNCIITSIRMVGNGQANFAFAAKLVKSLSPLPFLGPDVYLLLSAAASQRVVGKARRSMKGAKYVGSLKDGVPGSFQKGDVVVMISPCISQDYQAAAQLAQDGVSGGVVLINGLAKVRFSTTAATTTTTTNNWRCGTLAFLKPFSSFFLSTYAYFHIMVCKIIVPGTEHQECE